MLAAALAAFITVFVAEFGDKSQLVCLTLACRYPPLQVLGGAMAAMAVLLATAVLVGNLIAFTIPQALVALLAGLFFIVVGLITYFKQHEEPSDPGNRAGFWQTFTLIFFAEFGDKTQLATLFLAASLGYPLAVFGGALLAMFCNHLIAVYLGSVVITKVNPRYLKIGTAVVFVTIGLVMIVLESGYLL